MGSAGHPQAGCIAVQSIAGRFIARHAACRRRVIDLVRAGRMVMLVVMSALACLCGPAVGQWRPAGPAGHGPGPGNGQSQPQPTTTTPANPRTVLGAQFGRALKTGTSTATLNGVTPAQIDAALGFRPDPKISARVHVFSAVANLSARNPAFPKDGAQKPFESLVASHGYSGRNIADAYATLLWTAWQILSGDRLTDAQIRGIHQQVRAVFIGTPELRAIPAEMRQQLTEEIAYMVVELTAAMASGSDTALVRAVPTAALARSMIGVDLADLEITADSGFRPKRAEP